MTILVALSNITRYITRNKPGSTAKIQGRKANSVIIGSKHNNVKNASTKHLQTLIDGQMDRDPLVRLRGKTNEIIDQNVPQHKSCISLHVPTPKDRVQILLKDSNTIIHKSPHLIPDIFSQVPTFTSSHQLSTIIQDEDELPAKDGEIFAPQRSRRLQKQATQVLLTQAPASIFQ